METKRAFELEFISRILRDGSSTVPVSDELYHFLAQENPAFELRPLSLSQGTYIAFNMNVYVVKLKQNANA